jgi:endo-1,4-beta-xylanase
MTLLSPKLTEELCIRPQLPGYGMTFSASTIAGERDTHVVTITATNGNVGPAYTTQINVLTLTQVLWTVLQPEDYGNGQLPPCTGRHRHKRHCECCVYRQLVGCNPNSQFTLSVLWNSAVYDTGTFIATMDFKRGNGQ